MKLLLTVAILLAIAGTASAQQRPSLTDQKMCYDQARRYVKDLRADSPSWDWKYDASHYDTVDRLYLVRVSSMTSGSLAFDVDDAFEGTILASYMLDMKTSSVLLCEVGDETCTSAAAFDAFVERKWSLK